MTSTWDPTAYEAFSDHRIRPLHDLLNRVSHPDPRLVVDLGCGNGLGLVGLARRYPRARVVGVDSSREMLERAAEHIEENQLGARVSLVGGDITTLDLAGLGEPGERPDLVLCAAVLQWVPGHVDLLPGWMAALAPGGVLALQMPRNVGAPSHALMREAAAASDDAEVLLSRLRHDEPVLTAPAYLQALAAAAPGSRVDAWETTYAQVLDPTGSSSEHPVLSWVRGTALRPLLGVLPQAAEDALVADYEARLEQAYPRTDVGVVLPYTRVFAVAEVPREAV